MNGELAWLVQELLAAETNGELVHIINHIPPGTKNYELEFQKLVIIAKNSLFSTKVVIFSSRVI